MTYHRPLSDPPPRAEDASSSSPGVLERWEGDSVEHWARAWALPELHILARTTSTNDQARTLAERGAPAGTTVVADEQTAGKGRRGRSWYAPHGRALLLSIVLRPPPHTTLRAPTTVPVHVGLAIARAIEAVARVETRLKWPNDVLIANRGKVAGILCESALSTGAADYVIAGIGINANQQPHELPDAAHGHATSIAIAAGHDISRPELARAVLAELRDLMHSAGEPLDEPLLAEYARRDVLRGKDVVVDDAIRGTARGITNEGGLGIESPTRSQTLLSGTVRLAGEPTPRYPA